MWGEHRPDLATEWPMPMDRAACDRLPCRSSATSDCMRVAARSPCGVVIMSALPSQQLSPIGGGCLPGQERRVIGEQEARVPGDLLGRGHASAGNARCATTKCDRRLAA